MSKQLTSDQSVKLLFHLIKGMSRESLEEILNEYFHPESIEEFLDDVKNYTRVGLNFLKLGSTFNKCFKPSS